MRRASPAFIVSPDDELAVDRKLQILKRGVVGQRKEIVGFAERRAAIDESLFDLVAKHAIGELHAHVAPRARDVGPAVANRHGRRSTVDRHDAHTTRTRNDPTLRAQTCASCERGNET